jgi:predicted PurR-regulated permease PerM
MSGSAQPHQPTARATGLEPRRKLRLGERPPRSGLWPRPSQLAALVAVVLGAYASFIMVRTLRWLLLMLLVALFLSFAMEPAVQFLARRGWRRGAATGAVFLAVFLGVSAIMWVMAGFVIEQIRQLVGAIPTTLDEVNRLLQRLPFDFDLEASPELERELLQFGEEFGQRLREVALGAAGDVVGIGATAIGLVARVLAVALITFYIVADGPSLRRTLARPFPPERQREMLAIWELAVAKTGGYIYSRLLIGAVSGAAHAAALLVLGVPQALALGVWMGLLTALIPLVGVPLGGTLLLVVAFTHNPLTALWLLVFIAIYQQFENYIFAPKIQAHTMDLHPAVAFLSVLVGATLLGAVGALLALPAAAIVKAALSTYVHRHELIEELAEVPLDPGIDGREEEPDRPAEEARA